MSVELNSRGDGVGWRLYWELLTAWFKVGLFTFGGGYAMLPLIEKEVIDRKGWATHEEILDIFALAQSLPGAIAINTAIFLGQRLAGIAGAIAAAIGVVLPSLLVILVIAIYFTAFQTNPQIMAAFSGIRAAVAGLVAAAAVRISVSSCRSIFAFILAGISLVLNLRTSIHAGWIILGGALIGLIYYYLWPVWTKKHNTGGKRR